ncbi:rRNA maturation RNase YbeY [Muriicola sp.]|uniref:rRNA maturation RNase YbeY n=1 Tax=Muriicola sp. TaxID=2020856 RepID=UPI003C74EFAB
MIEFVYETDFQIDDPKKYTDWLIKLAASEGYIAEQICYILSSDEKVLLINEEYLKHTDYTDVITFDYSRGKQLQGDVFISIDRVKENALLFKTGSDEELRRVMAHGMLHLMGYNDKSLLDKEEMRRKEDEKLKMFHVEQ